MISTAANRVTPSMASPNSRYKVPAASSSREHRLAGGVGNDRQNAPDGHRSPVRWGRRGAARGVVTAEPAAD